VTATWTDTTTQTDRDAAVGVLCQKINQSRQASAKGEQECTIAQLKQSIKNQYQEQQAQDYEFASFDLLSGPIDCDLEHVARERLELYGTAAL